MHACAYFTRGGSNARLQAVRLRRSREALRRILAFLFLLILVCGASPSCALRVESQSFMAPANKPVHELGDVSQHGCGWRAWMNIPDRVFAPTRTSEKDADSDLAAMRAALSRGDVRRVLRGLRVPAAVDACSASAGDLAVGAYSRPGDTASGASVRNVADGAAAAADEAVSCVRRCVLE